MVCKAEIRELHEKLARGIADFEVAVKVRLGPLEHEQLAMRDRLEDMGAQLTRMEHDLAIIKEYLVTKMQAEEP